MARLMVACELVSRGIYACLDFGRPTALRTVGRRERCFEVPVRSCLLEATLLIAVVASLCL